MPNDTSSPLFAGGRVFAAPWIGVLSPAGAARRLVDGPRWAFWSSFVLQTLLLPCVVVFVALLTQQVAHNAEASPTGQISLLDVWQTWLRDYGIGVWIAIGNVIWVPPVVAVLAWMMLPAVHRDGGVWGAYKRSFAAASGVSGLVISLTFLIGVMIAFSAGTHRSGNDAAAIAFIVAASVMSGLWLIAAWLTRAASAVALPVLTYEIPLRCEGCGYDLTHLPDGGRCTECGLSLAVSIEESSRPALPWESSRRMGDWFRATCAVLLAPKTFYRRLRMRTELDSARRFAQWHFNLIMLGAGVWVLALCSLFGDDELFDDFYFVCGLAVFVGLTTSLGGWIAHRLVAAVVTTVCLRRRVLPDTRWFQKQVFYETAYLWTFCLFNGIVITAISVWGFNAFNAWLGFLPIKSTLGVRAVDLVFLLGNGALCILWFLRYRRVVRSVRWSNF